MVVRMETGRQHQDSDDIARLLAAYGATQCDVDRLTSLTGRADEAPWAHVVPDWLNTFLRGLPDGSGRDGCAIRNGRCTCTR